MRAWPRLSVLSVRPQGVSVPSVFNLSVPSVRPQGVSVPSVFKISVPPVFSPLWYPRRDSNPHGVSP